MPCPFFEPQRRTGAPAYAQARLPLIDEYEGLCHAGDSPETPPDSARFRCCNHGYSRPACARFPQIEERSALRYSVIRETVETLQVLCIEERDHIPAPAATVRFDLATSTLLANELTFLMQAQALAFCRSYADRFLRT